MEIKPLESIDIRLKYETSSIDGILNSLSDDEIHLKSKSYLSTKGIVEFSAKHFHGYGSMKAVDFEEDYFHYVIEIYTIHFQPGFLINCRS